MRSSLYLGLIIMSKFYVGLDLGQSNDYTAVSVLEHVGEEYHARHLARIRGIPYPAIVDKVAEIMHALKDQAALVVDQTGTGAPVVDLFNQAGLNPVGVLIHGGDRASHEGGVWRVPKRDLVACLQVLFQSGRLKISSKLPLAEALQAELLNFKVKIDPATAHDSYSAWREQDHDDMVLSVALAAWWAERGDEQITLELPTHAMRTSYSLDMQEWQRTRSGPCPVNYYNL